MEEHLVLNCRELRMVQEFAEHERTRLKESLIRVFFLVCHFVELELVLILRYFYHVVACHFVHLATHHEVEEVLTGCELSHA